MMFGYDLELQTSQQKSGYEKKEINSLLEIFFSNKSSQQI